MVNPVVLGIDKATEQEVVLSAEARRLGNYVVGIQGMGKSNLLLQIALADMANHEGVCVLTPHSELIDDILKRLPEDRWDDVIVFDPNDDNPIGLNIFEWQGPESGIDLEQIVDGVVFETFRRLWGDSWGPRMEEVLSNTARTIAHCQTLPLKQRPTLTEFAKVVGRGDRNDYRDFLLAHIQQQHPVVIGDLREYWQWLEQQPPHLRAEIVSSTLNKARPFRTNHYVRHVVGQSASPLDFRAIMDEGKILLADLNAHKLGTGNVELLGSLLVGRLYLAALGRDTERDQNLRPFHVIADEFAYFATPAFAALQDQARKFAVTVLVAHQRRGQLEDETKDATKAARNWVVFNVNPDDAVELSEAFDSTPPEPRVRGQRQGLVLAINPWDVLKRSSHEGVEVVEIVQKIEHKLIVGRVWAYHDELSQLSGIDLKKFWRPYEGIASPRTESQRLAVEEHLNKALYIAMTATDETVGTPEYKKLFQEELYGMVTGLFLYKFEGMMAWLTEDIRGMDENFYPLDFVYPSTFDGAFSRISELALEFARLNETGDKKQLKLFLVSHGQELACLGAAGAMCKWVERLGELLREQPVFVHGGQPEQDYELPRSFSDVTEEWKNRFAHLPQYEAWCRVQEDRGLKEYHIRTVEAPKPPENGSEIAQSIRSRSSATYGRSGAEIEADIAARMKGFGDDGDDEIPEVEIVD